jgi:hypothetical protein
MRVLVEIDLAQTALGGKPMGQPTFGGRIMSGSAFTIINR